jgi:DNA-directed RNA polymerase subunit F
LWAGSNIGKTLGKDDANRKNEAIAEKYTNVRSAYMELNESRKENYVLISETQKLGLEYDKLGEKMDKADSTKLQNNIQNLINVFPE